MFRSPLARNWTLLTSPAGFWAVLVLYTLAVFVLRVVFIAPGSQDDSEQLIMAQYLAGGYNPTQPPLYTWMVIAVQALTGPAVFAVVLVKFLCQFATFAFSYLAARRVLKSQRMSALSALSLVAVYYIGWETVFNYSHTPLWAAAMPATLHALFLVRDRPGWAAYLYLGAAVGVGMLSKYGYFTFLGGLAVAVLAVPDYRRAIADRRILVSLAALVVVLLPHLLWLAGEGLDMIATMRDRLVLTQSWGYWTALGNGLAKLGNAVVTFFMPLTVILLIFFPDAWWRRAADAPPAQRLMALTLVATLAIVLAGIVGFGVSTFRTDYAVVFLPVVLYFFQRIEGVADRVRGPLAPARVRVLFAATVSVMALVCAIGVPVRAMTEPLYCKNCYFNFPYRSLAEQIRAAGFRRDTIVSYFWRVQIGGNLKPHFPDSRVVSTKYPYAVPAAPKGAPQCLLVWQANEGPRPSWTPKIAEALGLDLKIPAGAKIHVAEAPLRFSKTRTEKLRFVIRERGCTR